MWQNIFDAAGSIQLTTVLVVLLGVVLGYVVGSLPGLTGTMTIALLLPFSFGMSPLDSIVLMASVFIGSMNGGSLAAILYNIPGTPSAAATVLDGYPLTLKGLFGKAVSTATVASFTGTLVSVLSLIFFAPVLAAFALNFSTPEFFALAIFGLTIVSGVSGNSLTKGLLAACFGLFLSFVGQDPIIGFPRLTFGVPQLFAGFALVPALIGLFGISEVFKNLMADTGHSRSSLASNSKLITWREGIHLAPNMLRSGMIGTIIGAIPGTGGVTAAFISYREAKRFSRHPERFGKGELAGVAAPEAGNNGVTGGVMIPLLTLGIPGDAASAVMLGAFLIHGIQPGPELFVKDSGLVYGLFIAMFIGAFIMLFQGLFFIKLFSKILNIDPRTLFPIIAVLTVVGAYATNTSFLDVSVMIALGLIGYLFSKIEVPLAPVVLGLVLGPILESNIRRAAIQFGGSYQFLVDRPITVIILGVSLLSVVLTAVGTARSQAKARASGVIESNLASYGASQASIGRKGRSRRR